MMNSSIASPASPKIIVITSQADIDKQNAKLKKKETSQVYKIESARMLGGYYFQKYQETHEPGHLSKVYDYFLIAADCGDGNAQLAVCALLYEFQHILKINKMNQIFHKYVHMAIRDKRDKKVSAKARGYYGECLLFGHVGIKIDYKLAYENLYLAAQQGVEAVYHSLGLCYLNGYGVAINHVEAFKCFTVSVSAHYALSHIQVGLCYENGHGVTLDKKMAFEHFEIAKKLQILEGYYHVGRCLMDGIGTDRDVKKGMEWMHEAALKGHHLSYLSLGNFYCKGEHIPPDLKKAFECFKIAADHDMSEAQSVVGEWYCLGYVVEENAKLGVEYLKKAMEQGITRAKMKLGECYLNGDGVKRDRYLARKYFKEAAEKGDLKALHHLGCCFLHGFGGVQNPKIAFKIFKRLSTMGDLDATAQLATCYLLGTGTEQKPEVACDMFHDMLSRGDLHQAAIYNYAACLVKGMGVRVDRTKAFNLLSRYESLEDARILYILGVCYEKGFGTTIDLKMAVQYFEAAAAGGEVEAQLAFAGFLLNGIGTERNEKRAVELLQNLENQNAEAINALAVCYLYGWGVPKNEKKAIALFKKAGQQSEIGAIEAWNNLGWCYLNGLGVKRDYKQAMVWFQQAYDRDKSVSAYNLGWMSLNGFGTEKNTWKAEGYFKTLMPELHVGPAWMGITYLERWVAQPEVLEYQQSKDLGVLEALSYCYGNGWGVQQDVAVAFKLFRQIAAADKEHPEALRAETNFGICYMRGIGVPQNIDKAITILTRLHAGKPNYNSLVKLADCFYHGISLPKNIPYAVEFYKLCAENGERDAQFQWGYCLENGIGVKKDLKSAVEYYRLAANQGHPGAQCALGWCYDFGLGVEADESQAIYHYASAAAQNNPEAQNSLAVYQEKQCREDREIGYYQDERMKSVFELYEKSAAAGNVVGIYHVAECLEYGKGTGRDLLKAQAMYTKAATLGDSESALALKRVYEKRFHELAYKAMKGMEPFATAIEPKTSSVSKNRSGVHCINGKMLNLSAQKMYEKHSGKYEPGPTYIPYSALKGTSLRCHKVAMAKVSGRIMRKPGGLRGPIIAHV